ncbi:MAG: glycosyltransferase family 2 protein, partial [Ktedonobacterales bacterium]
LQRQTLGLVAMVALLAAAAYLDLHRLLATIIALSTVMYLFAGAYKSWLLLRGERIISSTTPTAAATGDDLPLYTVLVPLHREGKILPFLMERLAALDYPADRLEILLLVESDDHETRHALDFFHLPPHIRPLTVPAGEPRTKPRALNVGLARARGEYIVVYDAEDRPEPDQLRKAVAAFRELPRRVVCLQARLNFYNARQSILASLFAVDYVQWYYMLLPGLTRQGAFVPLGGTSNHFRIEALRRLGGWDPYNVTEDCDLGARIARSRLDIAMLDSTTWEEAVTRTRHWVMQRSRWVKGYMQTYLVHMRHPLRLWRQLGVRAFADFQVLVGGSALMLLINPLMWALTVAYLTSGSADLAAQIRSLFPPLVYYPSLLCFVAGNFLFFYASLYVCVRHGYHALARYALLSPLYWLLMSMGAWAGFFSLVRHPHYWAKTEHGVSLGRGDAAVDAAGVSPVTGGLRKQPATGVTRSLSGAFLAQSRVHSISVVLPAFNEEAVISSTVRSVVETLDSWGHPFEILVVNDGSADRTGDIVREIAATDPRVHLIDHTVNQGYGAALVSGFEAATQDLIFFMDSDGQFDIHDLAQSLALIGRYDAVLGYRIKRQDTWMRLLNAWGWKQLVRLVFGLRVRDVDCAFKLYRAEFFRRCQLETCGAMINTEMLYKFTRAGYTFTEVGVRHLPRRSGRATGAKLSVIARAFKEMIYYAWKWRREGTAKPALVEV